MIRINRAYLDRFKAGRKNYLYPISRGIYLSFDKYSLEYQGLQMYYLSAYYPMFEGDSVLNKLLSLGYIEIYTD